MPFLRSRNAARKRWRPAFIAVSARRAEHHHQLYLCGRRRLLDELPQTRRLQVAGCLFQRLRDLCGIQFGDALLLPRRFCLREAARPSSGWSEAKASARAMISAESNPDCPESFCSSSAKARSASRNGSGESVNSLCGLFELLDDGLETLPLFWPRVLLRAELLPPVSEHWQAQERADSSATCENRSPEPTRKGAVTARALIAGNFSAEDTRGHGGLRRTQTSLDELHPRQCPFHSLVKPAR